MFKMAPNLPSSNLPPSRSPALGLCTMVFGGLWLPVGAFVAHALTVLLVVSKNVEDASGTHRVVTVLRDEHPLQAYSFIIAFATIPALCLVASGIGILVGRWRGFSVFIGWILCLVFPIGTALGVWTLVSLKKDRANAQRS